MEVLTDRIAKFLAVSNDFGKGYGLGKGDGLYLGHSYSGGYCDDYNEDYDEGYGYGLGKSNGLGLDKGFGNGYGVGNAICYGNLDGHGLNSINGQSVNLIDDVPTIITQVRGNLAKGYTLHGNVIFTPCYIAKCGDFFAHGKTAKEAMADAKAKYNYNKPIGERIEEFVKAYPSLDSIAKHEDLFKWHNILTGSCKFGREEFCKANGLDHNKGEMSIRDFISLTVNSYGGENINKLKQSYNRR